MKNSRYLFWIGIPIFLLLAILICTHVVVLPTNKGMNIFWVELARDERAWEKGLMERTFLPSDHGMLFVFPTNRDVSFWMKDTVIPLDILFLDDQKKVVQIKQNALPCTDHSGAMCENFPSMQPVRYVLELKAGETKARQILVGSSAYWLPN